MSENSVLVTVEFETVEDAERWDEAEERATSRVQEEAQEEGEAE